ncbi:MAG: sulfate reduction electron transfer complex DsrMKJOP subunit DsrJ [Proteobacteria bacterium]|nr:sulfate reduction electron transfer complex DsrMKJOP subunit DsrJ [Pseudomonadota bacterium]
MYDTGKIITGIILFLIIMLSPFWYNAFTGRAGYVPDLKVATDARQCVEDAQYMKARHMDLLNYWKKVAVRESTKSYTGRDGKTYTISLTGTCMGCHSSKAEFCDRCHDYAGVKPVCWDCHNVPQAYAKKVVNSE